MCTASGRERISLALAAATLLLVSEAHAQSTARRPRGVVFGANVFVSEEEPSSSQPRQSEPAIAANPRDGRNLVAGFHDALNRGTGNIDRVCSFAFSLDAGETWAVGGATPLLTEGDRCADPSLAADLRGNFYYAYLSLGAGPDSLLVAKSADGGRTFSTFSAPAIAPPGGLGPDKPYLAVDSWRKSRFEGNIYVSWTQFAFPGGGIRTQILVQVSTDAGATWSTPVPISRQAIEHEFVQGSLPVVAPDGTVYVFYADFTELTGPLNLRFSSSSDGGRSWSAPASAASNLPSPGFFFLKNSEPGWFESPGGFFSNSFPTAAAAPDGTLYVAWADFPNGICSTQVTLQPPCENSDVRMIVSRDRGRSWSSPLKVTDESNATDQFFPWMAAHPDGLVSLTWLDKRLDPNNENYDQFYTNTSDARIFLRNVRVSTATSIIGNGTFIGDYMNVAATVGSVFPIWADRRMGTKTRIFSARGTLER